VSDREATGEFVVVSSRHEVVAVRKEEVAGEKKVRSDGCEVPSDAERKASADLQSFRRVGGSVGDARECPVRPIKAMGVTENRSGAPGSSFGPAKDCVDERVNPR
jgi:hypothetical protein